MGEETRKAIGLFWDIENCNVPRYVSALSVVQRLRERFFEGLREAEFLCVCDINKENKNVIEELNNGQVNVVHVSATAKNAADDKIRQSLRRFADTHPPETKVILISGDVNFASELSDLRHRKHLYIILIHGKQVHEALLSCAHETYVYDELLANLPRRPPAKFAQCLQLIVWGYPTKIALDLVKKRLHSLSNNCGGRIVLITRDKAHIAFPTLDSLIRAKRRLEGEDVYGLPVLVRMYTEDEAIPSRLSPSKYKRSKSPGGGGWQPSQSKNAYCGPGSTINSSRDLAKDSYAAGQHAFLAKNSFTAQQNAFQPAENGSVYSATTVAVTKEVSVDYTQPPPGHTLHSLAMHQSQKFHEHDENETTSQVHTSKLPETLPNAFLNAVPTTVAEGNVPGMLNISSTYNLTYQSNFRPRHFHPHEAYPFQNPSEPMYNPFSRPARFSFDYNQSQNHIAGGGCFNTQLLSRQGSQGISTSFDLFDEDDEEGLESAYFNAQYSEDGKGGPVELTITNLDYNISKKEWRKILAATFQPQVKVLGICVRSQADNTSIASIKVPNIDDARYAISQFHRRKIGYKRINVTLNDDRDQAPTEGTKQETIAILSDTKTYTMPVFKFIENYEKRYHKSISVSDLYKMKDVVVIMDRGGAGRMVRLARGVCPSPSPVPDDFGETYQDESTDQLVCLTHCPEGSSQYAEALSTGMLPNVRLQRKHFAAHVHSLLLSHNGVMPLMSFPACYDAEVGAIPVSMEDGVPMEHLISCVPGVEIIMSKKGVKLIHFQENKDPPGAESICGRTSPMLSQQMALLSREIGDLLRQSRTCCIPASKFIPAYHHHFGRQCRVADYGYNKLAELFEALPHVLQVLGTGDRKVLTLSHRAQVKRFIADVLKVLKSQAGKKIAVSDLPATFERLLFRKFDITHYGVAFIEDMFMDIPPTSILITLEGNQMIMAIPKRDQTPEEMKRTEQFSLELVDLLKHNPQCRMTFNKFIPAYHHHFGRQCRVADYGFTRLTDLFESVSQVVEIIDDEDEKIIKLTMPEMRMVLAEQMTGLLRESPSKCLPLDHVLLAFQRQYGFPLRLADFGAHDVKSLLHKIMHCVLVDTKSYPPTVKMKATQEMPVLALRIVQLLMDESGGCLPLVELCSRYRSTFGEECDVQKIHDELLEYVQVSTESDDGSALIRLTAVQILGRDIRTMLRKLGGISLQMFAQAYQEQFFVELKPALYGFPDISSLLRALPHIVRLTGRLGRKFVELSPVLGCKNEDEETTQVKRLTSISRIEDYLSAPIPSAIPSPELQPAHDIIHMPDLMKFDNGEPRNNIWDLSDDEKKGLGTPLCRTPTSELLHMFSKSLPNFSPIQPSLDVFPGKVPLTSPFPPPPPIPTDIAPPPLTEEFCPGPQHLTFWRHPPPPSSNPPFSKTSLSCSASTLGRPSYSSMSSLSHPQYMEPASLEELPAASLQWKEMLERGWWNPTQQQLQNLASMGLLGLGQNYSNGLDRNVVDCKPRPKSAPAFNTPGGKIIEQNIEVVTVIAEKLKPAYPNCQPINHSSDPVVTSSLVNVDPSIIQSVNIKTGGPLIPCNRDSTSTLILTTNGEETQNGKKQNNTDVEDLPQAVEDSLNLSAEGEADRTVVEVSVKPSDSPSPLHPSRSTDHKSAPFKDTAALKHYADSILSLRMVSQTCVSQSPLSLGETRKQQNTMMPCGDASAVIASQKSEGTFGLSDRGGVAQNTLYASVKANDSFSLDHPLDTSSTRSVSSRSSHSQGSVSDSLSSSPSPRKNPRRAHLAAKFFNPVK